MSASNPTPVSFSQVDRQTMWLYIVLVATGWLMIFAVNYDTVRDVGVFNLGHSPGKQMFFILSCLGLLFFIFMIDWAFWRTFALVIYVVSLVILIGPIFVGREINGANAWYQIGGFTFQPSEIAKFSTCLAMAGYLSSTGVNLREWRSRLIAFAIFLVPVLIILLQKDTGSALVFFSFVMVLYREGLPGRWYAVGLTTIALVLLGLLYQPYSIIAFLILVACAWLIERFKDARFWWWGLLALAVLCNWWYDAASWALGQIGMSAQDFPNLKWGVVVPPLLLLVPTFILNYWRKNSLIQQRLQLGMIVLALSAGLVYSANFAYNLLAPHQQQRITIWLKPSQVTDTRGSAYNLLHSKMAIGSGGFLGKGFLDGNMTRGKYVPEQSTDFIFCTIGEEQGFIGVFGLIFLFTWLLWRITVIAERQRSHFSRIYAYGVAGILLAHFLINVGMTMGLFPIIGIPLPFVSAGGSSLIGFTLMIGVLLKLDSQRNLA
ncbi:MAG: rod shape-determining protein RodA [Saprospiraceae bacterium]|nr:rod shape-determining protein RodA [Saprospiraceae bacterium]